MITLNIEKQLTKIESWEDIETRPGFTVDIDPRTVKLKAIIGHYAFPNYHPCGLKNCRTRHGKGYLVVAEDGRETNIGHICGKTFFDADFVRMRRVYDADVRAKERRERLTAAQHRLQVWRQQIDDLKSGPHGASWIQRTLTKLSGLRRALPRTVGDQLDRIAKQRDGSLMKGRLATAAERERLRAQGVRLESQHYIPEKIGQLEGIAVLFPENDLRKLLVDDMDAIDTLEGLDIESLTDRQLGDLDKMVAQIEPTLARAVDAIAAGTRFLTKNNLSQFEQLVETRADHEAVRAFVQQLP